MPLPKAWLCVLCCLGPTDLKDFLAPDEEAKWQEAVETRMGEVNEREQRAQNDETARTRSPLPGTR
jgi:hypothetical protein